MSLRARGAYGLLSNMTGSNEELHISPANPAKQDNEISSSISLAALQPRKPGHSTPSAGTGRSSSIPRRSSLRTRPQLTSGTNSAKAGSSSIRDQWIPGLNLDGISLEMDNTKSLRFQHDFNSKKQFWKIFTRGFVQFYITLVLVVLLLSTIWLFSRKQVISSSRKKWFNAINTGLSLALGMSIASGFKSMAVDLRWWILSRQRRSLSEVDKILRSDSLTVSLKLLVSSFGRKRWYNPLKWRWKLLLACALWLLANLAAQVAVALVGLNYSADQDETFALPVRYNVSIPDMSQIYPVGFNSQLQNSIGAQQYTANSYGNMALGFETDSSINIPKPGQFWTTGADYFIADDGQSWIFVFLDSLPTGLSGTSVYTNRTVNSTWSCESWPVIHGGNGTVSNVIVLQDGNGSRDLNLTLPFVGGIDQTTYLTNPDSSCGSGCSVVEAFEASFTHPWYYKCNITVGAVRNGTLREHEIGKSLRQMASAGIALQGYGLTSSIAGAKQYQVYPSESTYGQPQEGYGDSMGSLMAQFSIGVVTAAALYSNQSLWLTVPGMQPQIGNQLNVSGWVFIWLILGLLVGAQGLGFVVTAFWANRVVVKDESVFATATLLRPIMESLGDSGNAAEGDSICQVIGDGPETKVIYTALKVEKNEDVFHLALGSHPRVRAFPEGTYD